MSGNNLRCLLVPVTGGRLMLPSAVVAEIIAYREPDSVRNDPPWLLGMLHWRGQDIPLVCLEKILGIPEKTTEKQRIVIFYGLRDTQSLPFYALVSSTMPHSAIVTEESLSEPKEVKRTGVSASVTFNEETAWLPNLDYLEELLAEESF